MENPAVKFIKWFVDGALGRSGEREDPREQLWAFENAFESGDYGRLLKPLIQIANGELNGEPFVGDIKEMLLSARSDPKLMVAGLKALRKIGANASSAIAVAGELCEDYYDDVRRDAAETVRILGCEIVTAGSQIYYKNVASVVPKLVKQLRYDNSPPAMEKMAIALVDIGNAALERHATPIDSEVVAAMPEIELVARLADIDPQYLPAVGVASKLKKAMERNDYPPNRLVLPMPWEKQPASSFSV